MRTSMLWWAADGVEGEGGAASVRDGADVAVGHQAQLDEGLEAVADAQHQAVPLAQQAAHRLGDGGGAEEGGDELGAAVRLVAAGEAAGQHDDLGGVDGLHQGLAAGGDGGGGEVADDQDLRGRRPAAGGRRWAVSYSQVGAGEHRDDDLGLGRADGWALCGRGSVIGDRRWRRRRGFAFAPAGVDRLQLGLPGVPAGRA